MTGDDTALWINKLQEKDDRAAGVLWEKISGRLVRRAKNKLAGLKLRVEDEEDIAVAAFNSLIKKVEGPYSDKELDSSELWAIVATITDRKVNDARKRFYAQKRGAGKQARGHSIFSKGEEKGVVGFNEAIGVEDFAELEVEMQEELARLVDLLDDDLAKQVALYKLDGLAIKEIAAKINRAERTVERKLAVVRLKWAPELLAE